MTELNVQQLAPNLYKAALDLLTTNHVRFTVKNDQIRLSIQATNHDEMTDIIIKHDLTVVEEKSTIYPVTFLVRSLHDH